MSHRYFWITYSIACVMAFSWVAAHLIGGPGFSMPVCLSKLIYGIPCPGCGTTRAVLLLLHGDILGALWMNPNVIFAVLGFLSPIAFAIMFFCGTSPYDFYWKVESKFHRKKFYIPLMLFELLIWIKNIIYL